MYPIKAVFAFLNGKKTVIGATMLIAAVVISGAAPLIPAIPALAVAVPALTAVGTYLGGVGLAHKFLKAIGVATPVQNQD